VGVQDCFVRRRAHTADGPAMAGIFGAAASQTLANRQSKTDSRLVEN